MFSIITLLIVLALSLLVTRIATAALTHTGLSRQAARFQARSAFTGVGFTTTESEKVVNHPVRRKILLLLMLMGNAGIVTAISTLIVSLIRVDPSSDKLWLKIAVLMTGLLVLWWVARSSWADYQLSRLISRLLKRLTDLKVQDYAGMLHLAGEYQIIEMQVAPDDWLAGQPLKKLGLRKEGIVVLGVNRKSGKYIGAPFGGTEIQPYDTLILYGRSPALKKLDERKKGTLGDVDHVEGVDEQRRVIREEHAADDRRPDDGAADPAGGGAPAPQ